jgi:hypothetical protein
MSLRTFIRIVALVFALLVVSPLTWGTTGPLLPLAALGLLGLTLGYLVLLAGGGDLTRRQLRYTLHGEEAQADLQRLEEVLRFLADKAGHFVVEANERGLFVEVPQAFDRYLQAQLPLALPETKLSRADSGRQSQTEGSFFLCFDRPTGDLLRWATEGEGRQVRLHIQQGAYATLTAQSEKTPPPGRWFRVTLTRPFMRFWQRLPLWDELSAGMRLSSLFPTTIDGSIYSSRSRLLQLAPPEDYQADPAGRHLGYSADGRSVTLGYKFPLFTVGAPSSFLVQQAFGDVQAGRAVVVVSPHRRTLEQIERLTGETPIYRLDSQNSQNSTHLAIVSTEEWQSQDIEEVIRTTQTFLADLGIGVELPAVGDFVRRLVHILAHSAQQTQSPFSFIDLLDVSRSTQALRAFLTDVQSIVPDSAAELLTQLSDDGGYVQAVTILSAIRTALKPLEAGPLQALCQRHFLNFGQALKEGCLLLIPMTNADFPEHDHLLSTILDLVLNLVLATAEDVNLALHLHEPHLYRGDGGKRWTDRARQDDRVSLLLDIREPDLYEQAKHEGQDGHLIFRWSEALASTLIRDWKLPASVAELTEQPMGAAIARLPGLVVALQNDEGRKTK